MSRTINTRKLCTHSERQLASHLFDEIKRLHTLLYKADFTISERVTHEYTAKMQLFGKVVHCLTDREDTKDFG